MITKGSKIKLTQPMGPFTNVGEVCEVLDVMEDGTIRFRFGGYHLGYMSYGEYKTYFEEYIEKKHEWTEWKAEYVSYHDLQGIHVMIPVEWRTDNEKRVQMRYKRPDETWVHTRTSCYPGDTFEVERGKKLARLRLAAKMVAEMVEDMAKEW